MDKRRGSTEGLGLSGLRNLFEEIMAMSGKGVTREGEDILKTPEHVAAEAKIAGLKAGHEEEIKYLLRYAEILSEELEGSAKKHADEVNGLKGHFEAREEEWLKQIEIANNELNELRNRYCQADRVHKETLRTILQMLGKLSNKTKKGDILKVIKEIINY